MSNKTKRKTILEELMKAHSEWDWTTLEEQAFIEIMAAYRNAPLEDQQSVELSFTLVKDFVRHLMSLEEKKRLNFVPQRLLFKNKLFNLAFQNGVRESQIRGKAKKTKIEKQYIIIADEFGLDIETVVLLYGLINGYGRTQEEVVKWANRKSYENRNNSLSDYYYYLETFLKRLSPEDFKFFIDKSKRGKLAEKGNEVPVRPSMEEASKNQSKVYQIEYAHEIKGEFPSTGEIKKFLDKEGNVFPKPIINDGKAVLSMLTTFESWEDARKIAKKEKIKKLRKFMLDN